MPALLNAVRQAMQYRVIASVRAVWTRYSEHPRAGLGDEVRRRAAESL